MARIYTRTGDSGSTRLFGGEQVSKDHARLRAVGTIDELMAHIGVVRSINKHPEIEWVTERVQCILFELGADLANSSVTESRLSAEDVERIEHEIDRATESCPEFRALILPGGHPVAAHLHVARTVCRRAERDIVALSTIADVPALTLAFINRLSDLLFILARFANAESGIVDTEWKSQK